nr:copia protein [Tanacetum cinerariifolium]
MSGIHKPKAPFNLSVLVTPSPLPTNPKMALSDPNWKYAINDEFNALFENKTWELVPCKPNMHIIRSMWIFRHELKFDGSFERYKAGLVGDGRSQQVGVDCSETFSPIVKPATIRVVLSLALSKSWFIHQLDVKNAFLHVNLSETVYMYQPMGFRDPVYPDYICRLKKSLYGLKQAPRAWYQRFVDYVSYIGFIHSKSDHSLFIYKSGRDIAYILLYVDDIILTASSDSLHQHIMKLLSDEFAMKYLGPLSYFLGIAISRTRDGLFLNQTKYACEILERAGLTRCKPSHTPVDTKAKLSSVVGSPVSDPTHFRSLAGALQYLTFTCPDISYAVQQICLHMHDPHDGHMVAMKRILRYIQGILHYGLHLYKSSTSDLVSYTDADWAGCPDTRRSTSGYYVYLDDNLVSWSSKRQPVLSRSSAEAEY